MTNQQKFLRAARRAVASFLFSGLGVVVANPVLNMDVAEWKLIVGAGAGAVVNLVYRWAEAVVKDPILPIDPARS